MKDENGMLTSDKDNPLTQKGELERLKKENAALGKRLETVNRELAKSEAECRDFLEEIKDRAAERDEALKRVAELEAEDAADVADAETALAENKFVPFEDMQPPFDGPIVGIEPVLDPARVLATAAGILARRGRPGIAKIVGETATPAPYKLKGSGE